MTLNLAINDINHINHMILTIYQPYDPKFMIYIGDISID